MADNGVLGFWDRANATIRIAALIFALVVIVSLVNRFSPKQANTTGPTASSGFTQVEREKDIPKKNIVVPSGTSANDYIGRLNLTVTNKYVVKASDTPGTVITTTKEIAVLIPKDDSAPPVSPADSSVHATYGEIATPIIELEPSIVVGATIDEGLKPGPFLGVAPIHFLKHVDLGAGISRGGIGPFAGYEFFREFAFSAQWNLVRFGTPNSNLAVGLTYRF